MPESLIIELPVKVYGPDMDCIGWTFMELDVSILVNGHAIDREDWS